MRERKRDLKHAASILAYARLTSGYTETDTPLPSCSLSRTGDVYNSRFNRIKKQSKRKTGFPQTTFASNLSLLSSPRPLLLQHLLPFFLSHLSLGARSCSANWDTHLQQTAMHQGAAGPRNMNMQFFVFFSLLARNVEPSTLNIQTSLFYSSM